MNESKPTLRQLFPKLHAREEEDLHSDIGDSSVLYTALYNKGAMYNDGKTVTWKWIPSDKYSLVDFELVTDAGQYPFMIYGKVNRLRETLNVELHNLMGIKMKGECYITTVPKEINTTLSHKKDSHDRSHALSISASPMAKPIAIPVSCPIFLGHYDTDDM